MFCFSAKVLEFYKPLVYSVSGFSRNIRCSKSIETIISMVYFSVMATHQEIYLLNSCVLAAMA